MEKRSAVVLGASGLVGQEVVELLLRSPHYATVTVVVRSYMEWEHEKLKQVLVDFSKLEDYAALFAVDDVYSCLGTTIQKAKTKEKFVQVDYEYTMCAARLAKQKGVRNFVTITSMGANSKSSFFYLQVKGKVEDDLKTHSILGTHIFRPSLLLGERDEFRFGEAFMEKLSGFAPFLFQGWLQRYKPIAAKQVAHGMYKAALQDKTGFYIYNSNEIAQILDPVPEVK